MFWKDTAPKLFSLVMATMLGWALMGCDRKETLLEVDTPRGELEVERSLDTGNVDVEVTED